ncbi:MAG: DUF4290 domain-containing protein [Bacteroidaceae bacterium]|nr:DUF4290 domain-containing protein [Bacteroidaceae bacterium]
MMERQMEYNTERPQLILPEYGRAVHEAVAYCLTIEDPEERQACAEQIVRIMASVVQERYAQEDTRRKLWNHLAQMSGYHLDVEYPVEIDPQEDSARPQPMPYPMKNIRRRQFGYLLEQAVAYVNSLPYDDRREALSAQMDDLINRVVSHPDVKEPVAKKKKKR